MVRRDELFGDDHDQALRFLVAGMQGITVRAG